MNFRELPEFKKLYNQLVKFSQDSNMSSYYAYGNTKELVRTITQKWLDENGIEANIRLDGVRYNRASDVYYKQRPYCITIEYIQIYNGKGSLDKKSRWLNKVTVRTEYLNYELHTVIVNAVARTDADFLEPTPTNFKDFINELFNALAIINDN